MLHLACEILTDWLRHSVAHDPDLGEEGWSALLTAARVHGVGPRLAPILEEAPWVPPEIVGWIETEAELNRQRVGRLCSEGAEILGTAASRGIRVLPLKGLALSAHLSSSEIERRPMADLDLLVCPGDAAAHHDVLIELGYRPASTKAKHDEYLPETGRRVASREHEHPENPRPVDVHVRCGEDFARTRFDLTEAIWSSAQPSSVCGVDAPVPGIQEVWTHLLLHAAWQWWFGGGRMVQLIDLVELLPQIPDPAAALGEIDPRIALLALSPTERLFPGRLPSGWVEELEERAGRSATRLAAGLDPVGSSHLTARGRSRLLRILKLHRDHPRRLARAMGYVFAPQIDEMLINHDRVPKGAGRTLSYPGLWLWHVANIMIRG